MATLRFDPPTMTMSGTVGGVTYGRVREHAIAHIANRRPRDASPRELARTMMHQKALTGWQALSPEQMETWLAAAAIGADPESGFPLRMTSGVQLYTSSSAARQAVGRPVVTSADEYAFVEPEPPALWIQPDLAAQTLTIRGLDFTFPETGLDSWSTVNMMRPQPRTQKPKQLRSAPVLAFDWALGVPGFTHAPYTVASPFPLLSGRRFSFSTRYNDELGIVSWRRWSEALTAPAGHGTAGFVRPNFFGLKSPAIQIGPGPAVELITTVEPPGERYFRDFSIDPSPTVDDVLDWIEDGHGWEVLQRDASVGALPAASLEHFGRNVVTINWQPRALFAALP